MPIRGSVHDGEAPDDAAGAVVAVADRAGVGCAVVIAGMVVGTARV